MEARLTCTHILIFQDLSAYDNKAYVISGGIISQRIEIVFEVKLTHFVNLTTTVYGH